MQLIMCIYNVNRYLVPSTKYTSRPDYHSNRLILIYNDTENGDTIYKMYVYYNNRIVSYG